MNQLDTAIVTCDSLASHVAAAQEAEGTCFPVVPVDRGLHLEPKKMQEAVLAVIDGLDPTVKTVLVGMGFCGGAWDQVVAPRRLVIPRADDCISILLHIDDEYCPNRKAPWHLYMYEDDPSTFSVEKMMHDVGDDRTYEGFTQQQLFHMFFDNYRNVDIVDTGLNDCYSESYVEQAQRFADDLNAQLGYAEGGIRMLRKLVGGRWDAQFIVADPGTPIRHSSFFE